MDIRSLVNALNAAGHDSRSQYHVTLGKLIAAINDAPATAAVVFDDDYELGPCEPHSYRGYYSDLAFEKTAGVTVENFRPVLQKALGATFEGYKGGDFTMTEKTPLWSACYGCCGDAIVDVRVTPDRVNLITKQVE